jgi:hypothetical protein
MPQISGSRLGRERAMSGLSIEELIWSHSRKTKTTMPITNMASFFLLLIAVYRNTKRTGNQTKISEVIQKKKSNAGV